MSSSAADTPYLLCAELEGHQKAVRCCCVLEDGTLLSAGLDGLIIVWRADGHGYCCAHQWYLHAGAYVYSLCAGSAKGAYSGGQDAKILEFDVTSGAILKAFTGHSGPVCSLKVFASWLCSGSWDSTARVWNRETTDIVYLLSGHAHAVTLAVLRPSDHIEDAVLLTGSQDHALRVWKAGKQTSCISEAHTDIIRAIAIVKDDGFVTASNDGDLKWWSAEGAPLCTIKAGHTSFVFDAKVILGDCASALATASDDCSVKIWRLSDKSVLQTILHAATVWQVGCLSNGDIVSCCEDGVLRVWTREGTRALPESARAEQRKAAEAAIAETQSKTPMEPAEVQSLPDASLINTVMGKKEGETKMFKEGNSAIAYSWSGSHWERMGEVIGTDRRKKAYYPGDEVFPAGEYDYVFNVEIGDAPEQHSLPFRNSDNPQVVAEAFCDRNRISRSHVEQIASFIRTNAHCTTTPSPLSSPSGSFGGAGQQAAPGRQHMQLMEAITFKHCNWDMLLRKLKDFNGEFHEDNPCRLSDVDVLHLSEAVDRCKQTNWLKLEFRGCEKEVIFKKLSEWPPEKAFPVMDLWRMLALHPDCACLHKGSDDGWAHLCVALRHLKNDEKNTPLAQCCLRYLANMFCLPSNRSAMLRRREQILDRLAEYADASGKTVRVAMASILANFAVAFGEKNDPDGRIQVIRLLAAVLETEAEEEAFHRSLAALEALILQDRATVHLCADLHIGQHLPPQNPKFAASVRVTEAAEIVLRLLNA